MSINRRFVFAFIVFLAISACAAQPPAGLATMTPTVVPVAVATPPVATAPSTLEMGVGFVTVTKSYYLDGKSIVREVYFTATRESLAGYIVVHGAFIPEFETAFGQPILAEYDQFMAYTSYLGSQGKQPEIQAALNNRKSLFQLKDGSYVEIRATRDNRYGTCLLEGAAIDGRTVFALVKGKDGVEKQLQYSLTDSNVLRLEFVDLWQGQRKMQRLFLDPDSHGVIGINGTELKVFSNENNTVVEIDVTKPCDDLAGFEK